LARQQEENARNYAEPITRDVDQFPWISGSASIDLTIHKDCKIFFNPLRLFAFLQAASR
jgi:hypothetical protein